MTSKIGEKQAAAMASLDQFCGVFSLFFLGVSFDFLFDFGG